MSPKSLTGS